MLLTASKSIAERHLSLPAISAHSQWRDEGRRGCDRPPFCKSVGSRFELRVGLTIVARKQRDDVGPVGIFRVVSRPLLGVTLRGYPAPCGSALFCFGFATLRVTVSSFTRPSANAELGTWEPGPLARLRQV